MAAATNDCPSTGVTGIGSTGPRAPGGGLTARFSTGCGFSTACRSRMT